MPDYDDLEEIELDPQDIEYDRSRNERKKSKNSKYVETTIGKEFLSYVKIILIAMAIAFVCNQFIIVNAKVPTGSMKNTITEGDRLIGFRLSYLFSKPQRGDVIIFKFPDDESQNYVKRIIGLPGDYVEIKNGKVYINGDLYQEDYLREPMDIEDNPQSYPVPEGSYFVMGDNRNNSLDSRYWVHTFVEEDKIIAKAIFKYYDSFKFIK